MSTPAVYTSERITVPAGFEAVFSHFYRAANGTAVPVRKTLLPSYQTILVFVFGAPAVLSVAQQEEMTVSSCIVLGPVRRAFDYTLAPGSEILVANFRGDAFYRFFGTQLPDIPMHPDGLLPENCFTDLRQLLEPLDTDARLAYILDFCRPYLRAGDEEWRSLYQATEEDTGYSPVKTMAEDLQLSERSIQLKHKKYLGYSAKEAARYRRFLQALEELGNLASAGGKTDWMEIVTRCGYYDQSQLIHDFKNYTQLSPGRYLAFQQDICRADAAANDNTTR